MIDEEQIFSMFDKFESDFMKETGHQMFSSEAIIIIDELKLIHEIRTGQFRSGSMNDDELRNSIQERVLTINQLIEDASICRVAFKGLHQACCLALWEDLYMTKELNQWLARVLSGEIEKPKKKELVDENWRRDLMWSMFVRVLRDSLNIQPTINRDVSGKNLQSAQTGCRIVKDWIARKESRDRSVTSIENIWTKSKMSTRDDLFTEILTRWLEIAEQRFGI